MSPAGPPPPPSDEGGEPSVGNILGFSLLFRERKALLALQRRGLAPGVRLRDYEAEIPGISFPIKGPLKAASFRHRRCVAKRATLSFEERALRPWLQTRLAGTAVHGMTVQNVTIELHRRLKPSDRPQPCVVVEATTTDGSNVVLIAALRLRSQGRHLWVAPGTTWLFGSADCDARTLWRSLVRRLTPQVELGSDDEIGLDAPRLALTRPFASAGWKTPDLRELDINAVAFARRGLSIELEAGSAATPYADSPATGDDPIARALDRARAQLATGGPIDTVLEVLEQATATLDDFPAAQLACIRWRVDISRFADRAACIRALQEWLAFVPNAPAPRRLLTTLLALSGQSRELAQLLAADCRRPHGEALQGRLELALLTLLVEKLDDPRSALAMAGPLVARMRESSALRPLLPAGLVALAQARVADATRGGSRLAPHALAALDEALDLTTDPRVRAGMRARVARSFAARGGETLALQLLSRAIAEDPEDVEQLDAAVALSLQVGEPQAAVELLSLRLGQAPSSERDELRRRLLNVVCELDDSDSRGLARRELAIGLEAEPEAADYLRMAADLERHEGKPAAAARYLARLTDTLPPGPERTRFELERTQLLRETGRLDQAWEVLRLLLDGELASIEASRARREETLDVLALALDLAPPTARPGLLDRLIETASGERRAEALIERAAQAISVEAKLADLWAAVEELDRPSAVLAQIAELLDDDDITGLLDLADIAAAHGDARSEVTSRARAGRKLLANLDHERAVVQLGRALELEPYRLDLQLQVGLGLEALGRSKDALNYLLPLAREEKAEEAGADPIDLALRCARILSETGGDGVAVELLSRAQRRVSSEDARADAIADDLFTALYRLGRTVEARDLARHASSKSRPDRRATWLVRAAELSDTGARLPLLIEAAQIEPDDRDVADALEAALRSAGKVDQLETHLRHRLDRSAAPADRLELLRRLVACIDLDPEVEARRAEASARYEQILELEPEDVEARLALGKLRHDLGDEKGALDAWRPLPRLMAAGDERVFEPVLALAIAAAARHDLPYARGLLAQALEVRPGDARALELLRDVARQLQEPQLALEAAKGLLSLATSPRERAALELECADAEVSLGNTDEAFKRLQRGAATVEVRSALHLQIAESWLELANREAALDQEAGARTQLRRALGSDLPVEDLLTEIRLLADGLGRIPEALVLIENGLSEHDGDARILAILERIARTSPHADKCVSVLRSAVETLGEGGARDRVAAHLAEAARARDEAATTLFALDRLSSAAAADPKRLDLRDWAIRQLDRLEEEKAEIESQLLAGQPTSVLVARLMRALDADPVAVAARLVMLAEHAERDAAIDLARAALSTLSELPQPDLIRRGVAVLVTGGALEGRYWQQLESAILRVDRPEMIAQLAELAREAATLEPGLVTGRMDTILDRGLARFPEHASLHVALARWTGIDDLAAASPDQRSTLTQRLATIAREHDLAGETLASLWITHARQLAPEVEAATLRNRALAHAKDERTRAAFIDRLKEVRRWGELIDVVERSQADAPADLWIELAATAAEDGDIRSEARARGHAGSMLLEAGRPEVAVSQLERALAIDPRNAALQHALGLSLDAVSRPRPALELLLPLALGEAPDLEADLAALAYRCGRLLVDVGDVPQAIELLSLARSRTEAPPVRRAIAEDLFAALTTLGRGSEARRLADEMADELAGAQQLPWLLRAADLSDEAHSVELLQRALAVAPDDPALLGRMENTLRALGDAAALEAFFRQRVAALQRGAGASAEAVAALRKLAEVLAQAPDAEGNPPPELVDIWNRILAHAPEDVEALMALAGHHHRAGEIKDAARLWKRAGERLAAADPRFFVPASRLAEIATDAGDLESASTYLERALLIRPTDRAALTAMRGLAERLGEPGLALQAARGLMAHAETTNEASRLEHEAARALEALGRDDEALTSLAHAVELSEPASAEHIEAAESWLRVVRKRPDSPERLREEARARAQLRRALGSDLPTVDLLAEVTLLAERLDRLEPAIVLVEDALVRRPRDADLFERLRELCSRSEANDRLIRALRKLVDVLPAGTPRDKMASEMAVAARELEAARSVLHAVDRMSEAAAGRAAMLDHREWAVRKLGKVEDELRELDQTLATGPPAEVLVTRLWRMLDSDPRACARRLLELASEADATHREWLARQALGLLREHASSEVPLSLVALRLLVEAGCAPGPAWRGLEDALLDAEHSGAPAALLEMIELARTGAEGGINELSGRAEKLLERALILHPDHAGLHAWLRAHSAERDNPIQSALTRLEAIGRIHGLEDRARARLLVGLADSLDAADGTALLRRQALARIGERESFSHLLTTLRARGAWASVADLLAARDQLDGVDTDAWLSLADSASDDPPTEARARFVAGLHLGDVSAAIEQLRRASALAPGDDAITGALARELESVSDWAGALALLLPLVATGTPAHAARCGALAVRAGDTERAAELYQLAFENTEDPGDALEVARALLPLLESIGRREQARSVASRAARLSQNPADEAAWLAKAAANCEGRDRVELLGSALDLAPHDQSLAADLESSLRGLEDRGGLERLLRRRLELATSVGVSDPQATAEIAQRLLALIEPDRHQERVELLEYLLRLRPDHVDARLELGAAKWAANEFGAASAHWTNAGQSLEASDPRFFLPAQRLAQLAYERKQFDPARDMAARALAVKPDDPETLDLMLEIAGALDDDETARTTATRMLALADPPRPIPQLHARLGAIHERGGQAMAAIEHFREAAESAEPGSSLHRDTAERWLRLATSGELEDPLATEQEAEARASLRVALADELPPGARVAEAAVLARLDRSIEAIDVLSAGLRSDPEEAALGAALETIATTAETRARVGAILDELVGKLPESLARRRIGERLARVARQLDDPALALRGIEAIGDMSKASSESLVLREWSIRALNRVSGELSSLDAQLLEHPEPKLISRMLRMLDDDGSAAADRLLELCGRATPEVASTLARSALELTRSHGPIHLDVAVRCVCALVQYGSIQPLEAHWAAIEQQAIEAEDSNAIARLLEAAARATESGHAQFEPNLDRLIERRLSDEPDDPITHEILWSRARRTGADARTIYLAEIDRYAASLGLEGHDFARIHAGLVRRFEVEELTAILGERADRREDDADALSGICELFRQARAWDALVQLLERRGAQASTLIDVADAAAADSAPSEARARTIAGLALLETGDHAAAIEQLSRAREITPTTDVSLALGRALELAGRSGPALDCLLEVLETPEPPDAARLAERCARLALAGEDKQRGAELLMLAHSRQSEVSARLSLAEEAYDLLQRLDESEQAAKLARECVEEAEGDTRALWLVRASRLGDDVEQIEMLRAARKMLPDDDQIADDLEDALARAGQRTELETLLRERLAVAMARVEEDARDVDVAMDVIHRLLPLLERQPERHIDVGELYATILRLEPDNVPALLALAELRQDTGDEDGALSNWIRAGELLSHDDDAFFDPACQLAELLFRRQDFERARILIERALDIRPGDREALTRLKQVAQELDDAHILLRATQGLLAHGEDDTAPLELEMARACAKLGDRPAAFAALERAAAWAEPGSASHREVAEFWLELALLKVQGEPRAEALEREAAAREQRRLAMGAELPATELRAEASLLVTLERGEQALDLVEERLVAYPDDELSLSALKDLCFSADAQDRYLGALERAIEGTTDEALRDRLATELAYTAVDLEDATKLLEVLDRISGARSADPELLDLREWAVRKLGRVEAELTGLDRDLLDEPNDPALRTRMLRMLDDDVDACIRRLMQLAAGSSGTTFEGLAESALALAESAEPAHLPALLDVGRGLVERGLSERLVGNWPALRELASGSEDAEMVAALIRLGLDGVRGNDDPLSDPVDELLDEAVVRFPSSPAVVAALWKRAESSSAEGSLASARARVEDIVGRFGLRGRALATLWSGLSEMLDRADAAAFLIDRAEQLVERDPPAFSGLVESLEARNHWPHVIRLLELRATTIQDPELVVDTLKHLSHICADILGDAGAAIRHLQRALEHAPEDPDLLLPLLDHHYERSELDRVIELSVRVMEHVPMGDTAFVALGHRAADAALAHGDHRFAESLLRRVIGRCPDDYRTRTRIEELEALADEPDHRCRMLQVIANRQTGSSRIEALEERARILVDPLNRLDDAILDLEVVLSEAPERTDNLALLQRLYRARGRWADLAALLERSFGRQAGLARSRTLRSLAGVYRDHLLDTTKAEQTLRLALETLGETVDEAALADELQIELVEVLEREGRYAEIVSHLRRELAEELSDELAADAASQRRIELLGHLARMLRDFQDDETEAARVYERLEKVGRLPEDGLATLARGYRNQHRHADLVRVLIARSEALGESDDPERKAEIDQRIGDLLEGPLRRPHEAARFYLDAYLANPFENTIAGQRARVLLAGTDSVVNVRKLLLERIQQTKEAHYPLALALLADLLAPHEEHEEEAETRYRMALKIDLELAPALEGLGRLLARQGRLAESVDPLVRAAKSVDLDPERAADDAATAARALQELDRPDEAEAVLRFALGRSPAAQRCLLELARLYGRLGRKDDEAHALDDLSALSLSSMLRAEVAFRRAMLLEDEFRSEPFSEAGELARTYLLEAVGSDAMHAQARQVLLDLATARSEWSIVAHMLFLSIRELPPGPQRALSHLDLAQVYAERLSDQESALRNLASALKQPTEDPVVARRAAAFGARLPEPAKAAERLEHAASSDLELDDGAKARLFLAAANLHVRAGNPTAAERASKLVMELSSAPEEAGASARQTLETLNEEETELQRERDALLSLLDAEEQAVERLHILGRLREVGRALSDEPLVERVSRAQLSLSHALLESDTDRDEAAAALLELLADRGDYGKIVEMYEGLADRTEDPLRAAKMLTDAARFAWTGQRDARLALAIIRRALVRNPKDPEATALMTEIATASDDPGADEALYAELSQMEPAQRTPALSLRMAGAALRLGRAEEGRRLVFQLLQTSLPPGLRLHALSLLDGILTRAGLTRDRIPVLEERLRLTQAHVPERAPDVALELASVQTKVGVLDAARRTCLEALQGTPSHAGLTLLYAELLERAEDWVALARVLEQLAGISLDAADQAKWLTRAARVHLEHPVNGAQAMTVARALLTRARDISPQSAEPRSVMLPLAFAEQQWDEVLDLTVQLRAIDGDDDETLLFGALTEALVQGSKTVARTIGPRHHPIVRTRILWPALSRIAEVVAQQGPLPRLDAVIGAAAALAGGSEELGIQLRSWAAGQPPRAGSSLILARLDEAMGRPMNARHLYQIAAFLAPGGPVRGLAERLPEVELPEDPLHEEAWIPREYRGALREILIQLRVYMSGLRGQGGTVAAPTNAIERAALNAAARPAARWRDRFGFLIPLRFTQDDLPGGCGVRNEAEPTVVISEEFASAPTAERNYRLAEAAANIAMGTAMLTDTHPLPLAGLLDALAQLASPGHEPRSRGARQIADTLAERGLRAAQLPTELRTQLASELEHWLKQPGALAQLAVIIKRAAMLMAVRLSGQLDGALIAMARERGMLSEDDVLDGRPVLETEDAQWLLRTIGAISGDGR